MGNTLQEKTDQLSPEHKAEVESRAEEVILEELSFRPLSNRLDRTQVEVAEVRSIGQDGISFGMPLNIMESTLI